MDDARPTTTPINPRDVTRVLTDLQVAIRKVSMYSATHSIIPTIVESLTDQFHRILETRDALHIGITKDDVLFDGTPIACGNPVIRELAKLLNQLNVAGLSFRRDLTSADIRSLIQLLAGSRSLASLADRDRAMDRFCADTPTIAMQFISFQGAVKHRDDSTTDALPNAENRPTASKLWRGLVSRLLAAELPESARTALEADDGQDMDAERMAAAVTLVTQAQQAGERSYDRMIVRYLRDQAVALGQDPAARARFIQEMARLFAALTSDVRRQLLRTSIEDDGGATPAEALLDVLPMPQVMEVLEHIQTSGRDISSPTLSLLKKFSTLAEHDGGVKAALQEKMGGHKELLETLLAKHADRTFYPSQYRALLDEEFSERPVSPATDDERGSGKKSIDDEDVNDHLALILLETLEAPIRSDEQYVRTVDALKDLLIHGLGDRTASVFTEAVAILAGRYGSAPEDRRAFFQQCVQDLLQREFLPHLLGASDTDQDHDRIDACAQAIRIAGPVLVPLLLDRLEDEQNLKARKRLLSLLRDCGEAVIPLAIPRLKHAQWYVVRNMLSLLRDLRAVSAVPHIAGCLTHASSQVRLAAFQTLGALTPQADEFLHALTSALHDPDPKVFRAAVTHIVTGRDAGSLALAERLLLDDPRDGRGERQTALLNAIAQTGRIDMLPLLVAIQRRYWLRFWAWRATRKVRAAADHAIAAIRAREGSSHVNQRAA